MSRTVGACLLCGADLVYYPESRPMECSICHRTFPSNACCQEGHFVCDECHEAMGLKAIQQFCTATKEQDPIAILQQVMEDPAIYMHGPEHHVLVGAALLTAYHNVTGALDLPRALEEMFQRGKQVPGGACGFWGCCGAGVSTGIFWSILTQTTPLSGKSWGDCNRMTARSLQAIGEIGGPRCCKRNSFTAVLTAVRALDEEMGSTLPVAGPVVCHFQRENAQCLGRRCPYNPGHSRPQP